VEPNVELAETAGLICANGIAVDDAMKTSADNILAIGDCVSFQHWMTGAKVRLESVQNATDQARLASRTIVGQPASYDAVPWFWSDIGDMKLQMVGLIGRQDNQVVVGSPEENRFSVYHFEGERLIAIESVNKPADHMLGRKMLAAGYSPARSALAADPAGLKAAFADWQQLQINSGAPDVP
ncbi:NAD(P)/FAD-dependent oxidoreductase, partial [Salmonella enterica subsp. enterica]|nr:NAD(P)/FAD-dependent oxidoreductase [Salmonella enterica subsp. enterica serovar Enteritidis]